MTFELSFDLGYNLYYSLIFLNAVILLYTSIAWHELGHMLYFKIYIKKNVKMFLTKQGLEIGTDSDYNMLTKDQYNGMLTLGVLFGLIPIFIVSNIIQLYLLVLIPYFVGCRSDLKNIEL